MAKSWVGNQSKGKTFFAINMRDDSLLEKRMLKGNPIELLAALRNSVVSGFRTNKMEDLKNYFLEQEYLDTKSRWIQKA